MDSSAPLTDSITEIYSFLFCFIVLVPAYKWLFCDRRIISMKALFTVGGMLGIILLVIQKQGL